MSSNTMEKAMEKVRKDMESMLRKCSPAQQNLFSRMYPDGVPDDKLDWALQQIERTLEKNK